MPQGMCWSRGIDYSRASGQANPETPACHSSSQSELNQYSLFATRTVSALLTIDVGLARATEVPYFWMF